MLLVNKIKAIEKYLLIEKQIKQLGEEQKSLVLFFTSQSITEDIDFMPTLIEVARSIDYIQDIEDWQKFIKNTPFNAPYYPLSDAIHNSITRVINEILSLEDTNFPLFEMFKNRSLVLQIETKEYIKKYISNTDYNKLF